MTIDTLEGQREIVIKSLGSHLRYVKGVSGVTIKGDGILVPIMNLEEFFWEKTDVSDVLISDDGIMKATPMEIMVIDDSVTIRQVVTKLMEDQGWKVQTSKDGIDALEKLRESKPDLIVLDIEMPRMNGYEFLAALKTQPAYQDIPVVMLTSRNAAKHRDKAKALGARGFVVKPYNDDEFINLILQLTTGSKKENKLNSEVSATADRLSASLIE
jgi:chemosensory pili system protein ChpA (sensor histidine kinase/response regulator)